MYFVPATMRQAGPRGGTASAAAQLLSHRFRGRSGCLGETTALMLSEPSFGFALNPHLRLDLGSKAAHFSVSAFVGYAHVPTRASFDLGWLKSNF